MARPAPAASTARAPLGRTASGWNAGDSSVAVTWTNTPIARAIRKKMSRCISVFARRPISRSMAAPIDRPRARIETASAPKSCTAPTKIAPSTTHAIAGSQPQMTAIAGPSIGDSPVIEANWCPNSTYRFAGT